MAAKGWYRDLTRECVEPNPGPLWSKVREKIEENNPLFKVQKWKPLLYKFGIELDIKYPNRIDYTIEQVESLLDDNYCLTRVFGENVDAARVLISEGINESNKSQGFGKKRLLDHSIISESAKKFCSDISTTMFPNKDCEYFQLPAHHFLYKTARTRFTGVNNSPVTLMNRDITKEMFEFVKSQHGQPAVYIHGPQGVGKSYSLYHVVCTLVSLPNHRVIYVPDCTFWGSLVHDKTLEFLLESIILAFSTDLDIIVKCNTVQSEKEISDLLEYLPKYCRKKNLIMYCVFDQHNGLTDDQRKQVPFSWLEVFLPSVWRTPETLMVLSASANNKYFLKVASDNKWPTFIMNERYKKVEFEAWAKQENFFPGLDLSDVEYWTNSIPYLLSLFPFYLLFDQSNMGTANFAADCTISQGNRCRCFGQNFS